jgi:hypothetical protein
MDKLPNNLLLSLANRLGIIDLEQTIFPLKLHYGKVLKSTEPLSVIKLTEVTMRSIVECIAATFSEQAIDDLLDMIGKDGNGKVPFITSYNKYNSKYQMNEILYFTYQDNRELYIEEFHKDQSNAV